MIDFTECINQLVKLEGQLTLDDQDPSRRTCANMLRALLSEMEMGFNGDFFSEDYVKEKCLNLINAVKGMKEENEALVKSEHSQSV